MGDLSCPRRLLGLLCPRGLARCPRGLGESSSASSMARGQVLERAVYEEGRAKSSSIEALMHARWVASSVQSTSRGTPLLRMAVHAASSFRHRSALAGGTVELWRYRAGPGSWRARATIPSVCRRGGGQLCWGGAERQLRIDRASTGLQKRVRSSFEKLGV